MGFFSFTCAKTHLPILNSNSWSSMPETYTVVVLYKNGDRVVGEYDGYGRVELSDGEILTGIYDEVESGDIKLVLKHFYSIGDRFVPEDTFESVGKNNHEPGQGHFHSRTKIKEWYAKGGFKTYKAYCAAARL